MPFSALITFLPNENALRFVEKWTLRHPLSIRVKRSRKRKLGDYRSLQHNKAHQISINNNLDSELFFLTLTHEIAHLLTFVKYDRRKVSPHGKEWKSIFSELIIESLSCYSVEFQEILIQFAQNPKAGYYSDKNIVEYFLRKENPDVILLKNLSQGDVFVLDKNAYKVLNKKISRYLCENITSKRQYLINGLVSVSKV